MDRELWAKRGELDLLRREALDGGDARLIALARDRQPIVAGDEQLGLYVEVKNRLNMPIPPAPGGRSR
jgi:predicted nucleic acid-binding protein